MRLLRWPKIVLDTKMDSDGFGFERSDSLGSLVPVLSLFRVTASTSVWRDFLPRGASSPPISTYFVPFQRLLARGGVSKDLPLENRNGKDLGAR